MALFCKVSADTAGKWRRPKLTWTPADLFHHATTSSHGLQRRYHSVYSAWLKLLHTYVRLLPQSPRTLHPSYRLLHLPRIECRPDYDLVNSGQSVVICIEHLTRRTHVVFSNSGQINKLLNIVLGQDILWTNAGSLKDSRRSECPGRKNDKTWRPGYEWHRSSTLCSSNCIINIFNSDCTGTPAIIKIMIREYTNEETKAVCTGPL